MAGKGARLQQLVRQYGWLWFGPLLVVVGLGASLLLGLVALEERRYRRDGEVAEATVVRKGPRLGSPRDRSDVVYRFRTPDGRQVEGRQTVARPAWDTLREGQAIRVEYLRDAPTSSRMAAERRDDDEIMALALSIVAPLPGLVFGGIGTFFFVSGFRAHRLQQRVRREGMPATATVTGLKESTYRSHRYLVVTYRYTDYLGRVHEGRVDEVTLGEDAAVTVGATVRIRYDRQRPALSVWLDQG